MIDTPIIELVKVSKAYLTGVAAQPVLRDVSLSVTQGEFVAIVGPSGNGKSTLLNLVTGIDRPSAGTVIVNGQTLQDMSEESLALWRGRNVGIVFQFFQLLPALTLLQNVVLPMDLTGHLPRRERTQRAMHLLESMKLADAAHRRPGQVSGGQQQRAAIARALANDPPLIVADEPTGNLDAATAADVFELFTSLHAAGKTLVMVTHNEVLAQGSARRLEIRAGQIVLDTRLTV